MSVTTTRTNKPIIPRGQDASPLKYNRAALYSGKALNFDGVNDEINGEAPNLPNTDYTICTYFRIDFLSVGGMVTWGDFATGERRSMLIWDGGHTGNFTLRSSTYGSNPEGSTYLEAGKWYFGCVSVASNGEAKIYLNGQLDGTGTNTINAYTNTDYYIGRTRATTEFFDGALSNVRVFNQVLTAAQVADLYNNPEKIVPTGVDNTALKLWLPMMEGAGTTAYDGSGNGNHGTISGATYVNGVGAPVAQSAVMDWNKGTNKLPNSLVLTSANYNFNETSFEGGYLAPDGTNTAYKITKESGTSQYAIKSAIAEGDDYRAIYARTTSGTGSVNLLAYGANTNNLFTITEEWQKFSIDAVTTATAEANFYLVDFRFSSTLNEVVLWAPHLAESESVYVPTNGTAQTSPVLLPQGLTSGRDITGVNLFENVRKQGALNLDGNSWAEVHDNASLDLTSALTMEAWVYWDLNGASAGGIMSKWFPSNWGFLFFTNAATLTFYISNVYPATASVSHTFTANGWYHLVGTDDGTTIRLYIDGVEVGSTSSLGSIVDTGRELEIGRYNDSINNTYQDSIAQPRIYNRALTAEEVQRNYDAGKNIYTNS